MLVTLSRMTLLCLSCFIALPTLAAEPAVVEARLLSELVVYPEREAAAVVSSLNDSRLEAEISAIIVAIPVRVGETVAAGDLLLQLDCRDSEGLLEQSRAVRDALRGRLSFAEFQLQRARTLRQSNTVSEEQLRERQSEVAALGAELRGGEAALQRASRDVQRCAVQAPFAAVVLERLAGVGERAMPGKPVLRLLALDELEVSAQVAEADVGSLQQVEALWLESNGHRYPLSLLRVSAALDRLSGAREVRLGFTAQAAAAGATGRLVWRSTEPRLPASLLQQRDGQLGVFVLEGEVARFVILPSAQEGRLAEVALPPATRVITHGRFSLHDGDHVQVVE